MIEAFDTLRSGLAVSAACHALGVPRAAVYRARQLAAARTMMRRRRNDIKVALRRGWDSDPRPGLLPTPVFKSDYSHTGAHH